MVDVPVDVQRARLLARDGIDAALAERMIAAQATRLQRKGFETSILLYGPGVTLGIQRGFPTIGDEA